MTKIAVIQARLDSTRLPQKALRILAGIPLIAWTMRSIGRVRADRYILAVDEDSFERLSPIAAQCGFECFAGPKEDVFARFCAVIRACGADAVLRATGDNPFLFYEAAEYTLARFEEKGADYYTLAGLPHGAGVEVFSASALLDAAALPLDSYDREHVAPSLYRRQDRYRCVFEQAPCEWRFPELRVTVDTAEDYRRAANAAFFLSPGARYSQADADIKTFCALEPPTAGAITRAYNPIVCMPAAQKGAGLGHMTRAIELRARLDAFIYIANHESLEGNAARLARSVPPDRTLEAAPPPDSCALVIVDNFKTSAETARFMRKLGPTLALDEGGAGRESFDYLIDCLPGSSANGKEPNAENPAFLETPAPRRAPPETSPFSRILVCCGGEDSASLAEPSARALARALKNRSREIREITVAPAKKERAEETVGNVKIKYELYISNLRERIGDYDLVVTHYGFTAFEAAAAGCAVILLAPTPLHAKLAKAWGFAAVPRGTPSAADFKRLLRRRADLRGPAKKTAEALAESDADGEGRGYAALARYIASLRFPRVSRCPNCGGERRESVQRFETRSFFRCLDCRLIYQVPFYESRREYTRGYFYEEYARQYGKTYLEDFENIKKQCAVRADNIIALSDFGSPARKAERKPFVLDIGCAYGPFLAAARDAGFDPFGLDPAPDAASYVRDVLRIPAATAFFPDFSAGDFLPAAPPDKFDAVTMWFVIEHFERLNEVLRKVSSLLNPGGVFAFSTPSASGVSARSRPRSFYGQSPLDHFSLWEPSAVSGILDSYGFSVKRVVSTGIHPERFPGRQNLKPPLSGLNAVKYAMISAAAKRLFLGDTFEVYAVKR